MSDARIEYDATKLAFDLALAGSDIETDDGLQTAVVLSLFVDRRVDLDQIPAGANARGWWADTVPDTGDRIGSRLWLLAREKQTQATLNRARDYAIEALQWLIDDGVARAVDVTAEIVRDGVLGLGVEIRRANQPVAQYRFESFWGVT